MMGIIKGNTDKKCYGMRIQLKIKNYIEFVEI